MAPDGQRGGKERTAMMFQQAALERGAGDVKGGLTQGLNVCTHRSGHTLGS